MFGLTRSTPALALSTLTSRHQHTNASLHSFTDPSPSIQVPAEYQPRALTWGIIGAVAMRGVMIFVGVAAIQRFRWAVLLFAGILLGSAFKLLTGGEEEEDLSDNFMLKVAGKMCNAVDQYDGDRFFTMVRGGWGELELQKGRCLVDCARMFWTDHHHHLDTTRHDTTTSSSGTASASPPRCSCASSASSSPTLSSPSTPSPPSSASPRHVVWHA